jgi:diacylglycerol kinase (ATP)
LKISVIANPIAGGGRAYRSIQQYIRRWPHEDWDVEILTTREPNHAGLLAKGLLQTPPDLLAICGGDGTINEVASHVPNPPFPIAILPAGTANVLARELGLSLNPVKALQVGLKRTIRRVDLGLLGPVPLRRFLFVAGIGFDAFVVSSASPRLKARLGMAAYALVTLDCLRKYSFPEFQVVVDNRIFRSTSCLVSNAKSYGGGMIFSPDADMADGLLDILVLEGKQKLALARFLLQAWRGVPESGNWIHRLRARSVKIEGPAGVFVQADGELVGNLPLDVSLTPSVFPFVIP